MARPRGEAKRQVSVRLSVAAYAEAQRRAARKEQSVTSWVAEQLERALAVPAPQGTREVEPRLKR